MTQDKMVRARRQYHHHVNHQHHHQNNTANHNLGTNLSSNGPAGGGGGGNGPRGGNRHVLNHHHHFHRSNKRSEHVPSAPSNTTQFIMNDHELIEPDFDLMHNAIMEHYNRRKRRKSQNEQQELQQQQIQSDEGSEKSADSEAKYTGSPNVDAEERQKCIQSVENDSPKKFKCSPTTTASPMRTATTTTSSTTIFTKSPLKDVDDEESNNHHQHQKQQQKPQQKQQQQHQQQQNRMQHAKQTNAMQLQESTNMSQPTTPNYRPVGSPGDEDGLSPFINYEHLQSEFQEIYANIHTERLSSMSKHQLVDKYLLLEERVEELENQLRESRTASAAASHG